MSALFSMSTHHRESLPLRLGPLLSECYFTVSKNECGYSPYESNICKAILSKDHSHEQSVIPSILKRGYYHPKLLSELVIITVIHYRCQSHHYSPFPGKFHIINLLPLSPRRVHFFDLIFLFEEGPYLHHL